MGAAWVAAGTIAAAQLLGWGGLFLVLAVRQKRSQQRYDKARARAQAEAARAAAARRNPGPAQAATAGGIPGAPLPFAAGQNPGATGPNRGRSTALDNSEVETKKVVIQNRGKAGEQGMAEVVVTGPNGTQTLSTPSYPNGAISINTTQAGIPGGQIVVEEGKTAIVTGEHPLGRPEEIMIVSTEHK